VLHPPEVLLAAAHACLDLQHTYVQGLTSSKSLWVLFADTGTEEMIPLPNVPGKILSKVIEYCKFHVEAAKTVDNKPAKTEDEVKQWDTEFVKVDQATLFDLILVRSLQPSCSCISRNSRALSYE